MDNKLYTEKLSDILKGTGEAIGIDSDDVKKGWGKAGKDLGKKLKVIDGEIVGKVGDTVSAIDKIAKKRSVDTRSIVARARNSVLQFPVYIDSTVRINEAQVIAKLFERVYTSFVHSVLSQNQILDEEDANNLVFLKGLHTNLTESADVLFNEFYSPIDELDAMLQESVFHTIQINERCTVEFRRIPYSFSELKEENARLVTEPLTGFSYLKETVNEDINAKTVYRTIDDTMWDDIAANDINMSDADRKLARMTDKQMIDEYGPEGSPQLAQARHDHAHYRKELDNAIDDFKNKIKDNANNNNRAKGALDKYRYVGGQYKFVDVEATSIRKVGTPDAPKMLRDGDLKKLNNMEPWKVEAAFRVNPKNGASYEVRYVIGIKSVLHLIQGKDLAEDLQELITGDVKSLQKVRYKTGEIKFRDYFWNLKGLKADAAKHINYNKRWINTLKRLAEYRKMNGAMMKQSVSMLTKGNIPVPNGTLILTQPTVTMLTQQTGIDLSKVTNAKRLAKTLFLIGIVIVDSSSGKMKVLFPDMNVDWDVQSIGAIDAEVSKADNSVLAKELNRMVNR